MTSIIEQQKKIPGLVKKKNRKGNTQETAENKADLTLVPGEKYDDRQKPGSKIRNARKQHCRIHWK